MIMICASDAANIAAAANVSIDKREREKALAVISDAVKRRAKLGGNEVSVPLDRMTASPSTLSYVLATLRQNGFTVSKRDDRMCPNNYLLTIKWKTSHDLQNY